MSRLSNSLKVIEILKSNNIVRSNEISEKLNTSDRMVRKYITDLKEAGLNIVSISGPKGGYKMVRYNKSEKYEKLLDLIGESFINVTCRSCNKCNCDDCHYKNMNWSISEEFADRLVIDILDITEKQEGIL